LNHKQVMVLIFKNIKSVDATNKPPYFFRNSKFS
jgi:hypothetical protein